MNAILHRLPAFALPFVTRSLRGGRGKRFAALSLLLSSLTVVMTMWIGLGSGSLARDARISIGVERHVYVREQMDFVVIRSEWDTQESVLARQVSIARQGLALAEAAAETGVPNGADDQRLRRAAEVLVDDSWLGQRDPLPGFSWDDRRQVERLANVVAHGGEPRVLDYAPALGIGGTLRLLAMICGGLLVLLFGVLAPILVALQQASERHENTLQPLTGTSLGARELLVGLACGPLAVVGLFAAPIGALFVGASVLTGEWLALAMLPALAGIAVGLVFGAQLLAHLSGARRTPGLIAVALICTLGMLMLMGMAFLGGVEREIVGFAALLPHVGIFAILGEALGEPWRIWQAAGPQDWEAHSRWHAAPHLLGLLGASAIGTIGAASLGLLALRALERHIEGRPTLLEASGARFGALVCIVMVAFAIPTDAFHGDAEPYHQAFGLPLLSLPFLLLLMARVPVSDIPSKLRRIPLRTLFAEFGSWVAVYMLVGALLDGTIAGLHPLTVLGVGWCAALLVLLGVRLAATPGRILGHVWVLACLGMLPGTFAVAMVSGFEPESVLEVFEEVPALMTITWVAMLAIMPMSLVRHLRRHTFHS